MNTEKYGVIGFIGNKAIAQLRVSNENYQSYVKVLGECGMKLAVDYDVVLVTNKYTTIQIICEMPTLNRIKIQTRVNKIKALHSEIADLKTRI